MTHGIKVADVTLEDVQTLRDLAKQFPMTAAAIERVIREVADLCAELREAASPKDNAP